MKYVELTNGHKMPLLGLGTAEFNGHMDKLEHVLKIALDIGYRMIDTAKAYESEETIGKVLKEFKTVDGHKLKREDIFVVTKLWYTHLRTEDVEGQIRESLKRLQLDYVDLYLVHHPTAYSHDGTQQDHSVKVEDTWRGMEQVYNLGLARAIGVSNFSINQMKRIQKMATVPIHNYQAEIHLNNQNHELRKFCNDHNITLTAYTPLGSKDDLYDYHKTSLPKPLENPVVFELSQKYVRSPAQILLRHLTQQEVAVIPKSCHDERLHENYYIFDFELEQEDIEKLNNMPQSGPLWYYDFYEGHPENPYVDK